MIIKNIGIEIDDNIIEKVYKPLPIRKKVKFNPNTNFKTGHISWEDGIFLPEGTYVAIKENGEKDKYGVIFHCFDVMQYKRNQNYEVRIMNVDFDILTDKKNYREIYKNTLYVIIKNIYISHKNITNKYLQIITYEREESDDWTFVRIEYGRPTVKMNKMYGFRHKSGLIYKEKNLDSEVVSCLNELHDTINVFEEDHEENKVTNVETKIKPENVMFAPYEKELLILYILVFLFSIIFKDFIALWVLETIVFLIVRKVVRSKYNL